MDSNHLHALLAANKDELYSLLGAASLSIVMSPIELLEAGRAGDFYASGPKLLGSGTFDHEGLKKAAAIFLGNWGTQIRKAICGKEKLYAAEKKEAGKQVDVWVATLVATLTASIPELRGFAVVINILAVIVVRSGLKAFCEELSPGAKK